MYKTKTSYNLELEGVYDFQKKKVYNLLDFELNPDDPNIPIQTPKRQLC